MVIENFTTLSQEELNQFALKLLDKVNEKDLFNTSLVNEFTCSDPNEYISADDMSGDLYIGVDIDAMVTLPLDRYGDYDIPYLKDVDNFGKNEAFIDGYKLTLKLLDVHIDYDQFDDFMEKDEVNETVDLPVIVEAWIIVEPAPKQ